MKLRSGSVHVRDHGADVSNDRGEDENADEEVDGDEEVLDVLDGLWRFSDGGQREGGPVETVNVLRGQFGRALVDPAVALEADVETQREEEAGVPVDEHQNVEDDFGDSEGVGEVGPGLRLVKELDHAVDAKDSVQSDDDRTGHGLVARGREEEIGEIRGQNADGVQQEEL